MRVAPPPGITLTSGHVHLALRELLQIPSELPGDPGFDYKLTAVAPSTPLPLFKKPS